MSPSEDQTTADRGAGIEILSMPGELDLTTSEGVVTQGYAAIARAARLLLLDLTGLSFCDARGLSAFVRIANQADAAGCGFGLIAPRGHRSRRSCGSAAWTAGCRCSSLSMTHGRSSRSRAESAALESVAELAWRGGCQGQADR